MQMNDQKKQQQCRVVDRKDCQHIKCLLTDVCVYGKLAATWHGFKGFVPNKLSSVKIWCGGGCLAFFLIFFFFEALIESSVAIA